MHATGSGFPQSIGKKCTPTIQLECCVEGCSAKYGQINVSFHRFPTIHTARDALRREQWIEAAGLPNIKQIIDNALICGHHFVKGKPSLPTEIRSANWVPTLKLKAKQGVPVVAKCTFIESAVSDSTSLTMNTITPQQLQVPSVPPMAPQLVPKDVYLPAFCRLCLAEDVHMVFPKERKVYQQLAEKLKECLNLVISIGELTYSLICKKCYQTLEQLHQFRTRCARQNSYLNMRKSLEPNRNQLLRYKDNWYWYSCIGNGMMSVIWGCSVVCCPAFIVSHPSGKICSKYANHMHKQKMEDVKAVYCRGEYIFDGYRYSFEHINSNRTQTFSCRSLHDHRRSCQAVLITNDRSEVLSVRGVHNHEREIIIESAVKDGSDGTKRSITMIRGFGQEIVFCQGFWYTTLSEQTNISNWNCIRENCTSAITMTNGVVRFFGKHKHLPVFLKWGAGEDKTMEPKGPTLMKVVPPTSSKFLPARANPPFTPIESTAIVQPKKSGQISESDGSDLNMMDSSQSTIDDESLLSTIKVEPNTTTTSNAFNTNTIVQPSLPSSLMPRQPLVISAAAMASKAANSPNVVVRMTNPLPATKSTTATTVRVVPPPLLMQPTPLVAKPKPIIPVSGPTFPKIVHVMSLNLNHSSNQPKETLPEVSDSQPQEETESNDLQPVIKQEPMDEPETITDDIQPTMAIAEVMESNELPKPPPLIPKPMALVSSASVISDNMLRVTTLDSACIDDSTRMAEPEDSATVSYENELSYANVGSFQAPPSVKVEEENCLTDLQDDEEIPPIIPIDADMPRRMVRDHYCTKTLPNGKTQVIRKTIVSRFGNKRIVHSIQTPQRSSLYFDHNNKSTVPNVSSMTASSNSTATYSLNREPMVRMYGPSSGTQKAAHKVVELNNSHMKKIKSDEPMPPLETTIVDAEKYIETDGLYQEQSSAVDPIAVTMEPHQNVESDDDDEDQAAEAEEEEEEEEEDGSSSSDAQGQQINTDNPSSTTAETPVETGSNIEQPAEPTLPIQPKTTAEPSLDRSDKKMHSKTVQLVKLQKTEQMLSHEGHLYKIKWHNRRRIYWDCMLREQVSCMAILETQCNVSRLWNKIGSHNHKVPKPIINDDNRGRYQMLTNDIGAANTKQLPCQMLRIEDIVEQEGRMMSLAKRRMFSFKIRKNDNGLLIMYFAQFEYEIEGLVGPGFRWICTTCSKMLETDEKFTVAKEIGTAVHDHEPQITIINLDDEATPSAAKSSPPADGSDLSSKNQQQSQAKPADDGEERSSDKPNDEPSVLKDPTAQKTPDIEAKAKSEKLKDKPILPTTTTNPESDADDGLSTNSDGIFQDSGMAELNKGAEPREDGSDEEDMILDPSSGEMFKRGDLKRKEYRKAILEDTVADDDDDEAEYLDPLTGMMRRKGDKSLSEDEPIQDEDDTEVDESTSQDKNIINEDFEELLNPDQSNSTEEPKKPKKAKKNSLAALKQILTLHKRLIMPDSNRNFQVIPSTHDTTCLIQYNEYIYELDTIIPEYSVWKCNLSPQYACRGKVHLSSNCRMISVSGVNHCHVPTLKDMFIERPDREDGQIKDSDNDSTRTYTFLKRPNQVYQLDLDDGYLYNCITVSKTAVSCWRCVFRQKYNCKAIITMEGEFESMTRNRFSHSHGPAPSSEAEDEAEEQDDSIDSPVAPAKRASRSENENDRKKRKRQTL